MSHKGSIKTPHAAVIIWNYDNRIDDDIKTSFRDNLSEKRRILSTLSLVSIKTNKSKGQPVGTFELVLSPFKNWVETITPGSWCCILMSNTPLTEKDVNHEANKKQVKMIGRIESVHVTTQADSSGARQTTYTVSGVDWGHIFNNIVYIDNNLESTGKLKNQTNGVSIAMQNLLFGDKGQVQSFSVRNNLKGILNIFGKGLQGYYAQSQGANRISNAIYSFNIPSEMQKYFKFSSKKINTMIKLKTGSLKKYNEYNNGSEAWGFVDPFSLQGQNTFWQILLENSNPALNEMICELNWPDNQDNVDLTLYNRIRPFAYKKGRASSIRSPFKNVKTHKIQNNDGDIDSVDVIAINAGTNWRDKYNFVEIRPQFAEFRLIQGWATHKTQTADEKAFEREGFRPLFVATKQFPVNEKKSNFVATEGADWTSEVDIAFERLESWGNSLKEWYFNTHRMLNGTMVLHGIDRYIAVGDNIRFESSLINPTPNMNKQAVASNDGKYVLAHVENVSHSFSVSEDGARTYTTTIQFVRGIFVDDNNDLFGEGTLDLHASEVYPTEDRNRTNVVSTSSNEDPDDEDEKQRGT